MSGEKRGARETMDRMTERLVTESRGKLTQEQAENKSRAAARYVIDGVKRKS
jgi:hypothetical protein